MKNQKAIKAAPIVAFVLVTGSLTGCGAENGFGIKFSDSVVLGTRSFLSEVNRGKQISRAIIEKQESQSQRGS